ncbi:hypothetical protein BHM03_00062719 [Ensete ventricosum]|nr:hypothetical protein BHM03_00062719 [Ensete ventricosum]
MGSRTSTVLRKNAMVIYFARSRVQSQVSIGFSCTVLEIQILAIPDVLAYGKSYEHGFTRKCDGHKFCAKSRAESSFDRFFMHCLRNSKYWSFPTCISPWEVVLAPFHEKT